MSTTQLVENLVDHLAWPAVVAGGAILFRNQIGNLIDRISEVKFPGGQISARRIGKLHKAADVPSSQKHRRLTRSALSASAATQERLEGLRLLAGASPSEATIDAHDYLAEELRKIAQERGGVTSGLASPTALVVGMKAIGVIAEPDDLVGEPLEDVLADVTKIARDVQNGAAIRESEALSYIDTIGLLLRRALSAVQPRTPPGK